MPDTLEALAAQATELELGPAARSKRMLVIVNPYASTVSDRLRQLVVSALHARYDVSAVDTERRSHATELCREAAHEGYDVVVAFGGDGTVNEAANGLAGSPTPLTCLPGGSTNVYCRMLGVPNDIVDATEHLLRLADDWRPRRVDLGTVNGRHFLFSCGIGLDASVVERVDANPGVKKRFGEWYFTWAAISTFARRYLVNPPRLRVETTAGDRHEGITAIVQNSHPFSYFRRRPIDIADGATLDGGTLSAAVLRRASPLDGPTIAWRAFSERARLSRHRHITPLEGITELRVTALDERPHPLQVDGDHIGDVTEAEFSIVPKRLAVVG